MKPNPQERARRLAALESSLAAELTRTRTMTIAVASTSRPAELEPVIEAWIADWTEYHVGATDNRVVRDVLPVAIDQVSVQRVAAAVWTHHQQEWKDALSETAAAELLSAVGDGVVSTGTERAGALGNSEEPELPTLLSVSVPSRIPPKLRARVKINDEPRKVLPSVAKALLEVAEGAELVRFRKETHTALLQDLPELGPHLIRLDDRKVINNRHSYRPSDHLRMCLKIDDDAR